MNLLDIACILHLVLVSQHSDAQLIVQTAQGGVQGRQSPYDSAAMQGAVVEYLGIPYAEPPVGSLRFREPVESTGTWNGTLDATTYPSVCPQDADALTRYSSRQLTTYDADWSREQDEDCLYLNIYAKDRTNLTATELRPVMVFLHGGEFSYGTGNLFNGALLASIYDVVFVSINYRVGIFGFISNGNSDLPGNYGLKDQQLALKWIKNNIGNFGGDANRVNLMGEGEGGSSTHLHTAASSSAGLFQHAIIQSASYDDQLWNQQQAHDNYNDFMSTNNSMTLDELRDMPWDELLYASSDFEWYPVNNENFVSDSTTRILSSDSYTPKFRMLVGSNNLASLYVSSEYDVSDQESALDTTSSLASLAFCQMYPNITVDDVTILYESYISFYGGHQTPTGGATFNQALNEETFTDQLYSTWAQEISLMQSSQGGAVYAYHLQKAAGDVTSRPLWAQNGAANGDDLTYIFGYVLDLELAPTASVADRNLAREMMTYWTNFATSGDPNSPVAPDTTWPSFKASVDDSDCRQSLDLNAVDSSGNLAIVTHQYKETTKTFDFWIDYYNFLGFSCVEVVSNSTTAEATTESPCEDGVWSIAGIEMTNQTAGILLGSFVTASLIFLLLWIICWVKYSNSQKRLKKLSRDDTSSTYSNDANNYL